MAIKHGGDLRAKKKIFMEGRYTQRKSIWRGDIYVGRYITHTHRGECHPEKYTYAEDPYCRGEVVMDGPYEV